MPAAIPAALTCIGFTADPPSLVLLLLLLLL
jgi:hypothetical protein